MEISNADKFWNDFIKSKNLDPDTGCSGDINFESKGITNDGQIAAILSGQRTVLFSSFASYSIDGEPLPVSGELYLVFDRGNNPRAVIELESVNIVPFNQVTWEMASKESEDSNLEEWRIKEQEILEEEGDIMGFEFNPDIKIVVQSFHLIYK